MFSFNKDFSFKNLTETRDGDDNTYTFGLTGNNYETVDIYKEDILPQVYAYKDNNEVRLLTEDDLDNIEHLLKSLTIVLSNNDLLNSLRLAKNENKKLETIINQIDELIENKRLEGLVDSQEIESPHSEN